MISTSQFKAGIIIRHNNEMCEILDYQLVKMQQRQPIVRTRMRSLKTGNVIEQAFRSGEKFEEVYLEDKSIQFLYSEGDKYHFMDSESYHEVVVGASVLGDKVKFLKDNSEASGRFYNEEMISVELPASVNLIVKETEPGIRGDTAKSGTKPAKLETGAMIKVPLFVNTGDTIRVDTRTGEYLART